MIDVKVLKDGFVEVRIENAVGRSIVTAIKHRSVAQVVKLADKANIPSDDLFAAIQAALDADAQPEPVRIRVRWRNEPEDSAAVYDSFQDALLLGKRDDHPEGIPLEMRWRDTDQIAALDIDGVFPPHALTELTQATPSPAWVWRSHGGGLRGIFYAVNGLSAAEAASLAALFLSQKPWARDARFELLSHTSHPLAARRKGGEWQRASVPELCTSQWDGSHIWASELHGEADPRDVEQWLSAKGLSIGDRYDHSHCPFDPHPITGQSPVTVLPQGINCFKCRNTGHPSRGFATWGKLLGKRGVSLVYEAARCFAIWEHAKYVAQDAVDLPELILRHAYTALVKTLHGPDDPRAHMVSPKKTERYVRGSGNLWLDPRSLLPVTIRGATFLQDYPSTMRVNEEREMKVDATLKAQHYDGNVTLAGYVPILPLRGAKLWGGEHHDGFVRVPVPSASRTEEHPANYLLPRQRAAPEEAGRALMEWFPGINLYYLKLLIGGRIYGESATGSLPMIAVQGVSGSGKTQTVKIAAVACGDDLAAIDFGDRSRIDESIGAAAAIGGIILGDEFNKGSPRDRKLRADSMLHLHRSHSYRRLYQGPVTVPLHALIVLTDTQFDSETFLYSVQIGRRFVYVELPSRVPRWEDTCPGQDITQLRANKDRAHLLDSLISYIADECAGFNSWQAFYESLGYETVESEFYSAMADVNDLRGQLSDLWALVLAGDVPPAPPEFKGDGWLAIKLDGDESPEAQLWRTMFGAHPDSMHDVTAASEHDLGSLLGIPHPVFLQAAKVRGRVLAFRFVDKRRNPTWVNGETIV